MPDRHVTVRPSPWAGGDYPLTPGYPVRQPRLRRLTPGQRRMAVRMAKVLAVLVVLVILREVIITVVLSAIVLGLVWGKPGVRVTHLRR